MLDRLLGLLNNRYQAIAVLGGLKKRWEE